MKERTLRGKVTFSADDMEKIRSIDDKVILQIMHDALTENDEPLRIIEGMGDLDAEPVEFDVDDSVILDLMYWKKIPR